MAKRVLHRTGEASDDPSIRALTIDVDMHHHLLAVLINAVDQLPGGAGAITGAIDQMAGRNVLAVAVTGEPDPSISMARQFIAAQAADRIAPATSLAPGRPNPVFNRREAHHVE